MMEELKCLEEDYGISENGIMGIIKSVKLLGSIYGVQKVNAIEMVKAAALWELAWSLQNQNSLLNDIRYEICLARINHEKEEIK